MTENKMVGWLHRLNRHEVEQALADVEGQGSLARCSPRDRKKFSCDWTTKWKKSLKSYLIYDSNYIILWKRQNHKDSAKISDCHGFRERREGEQAKHSYFFRTMKLFCVFCSEHRPYAFVKTHGTLIAERMNLSLCKY